MRIYSLAIALAASMSLSGCAVQKSLTATGGSRADGTVKMSYTLGIFEVAKVDWSTGASTAAQRCAAWGYSNAEPFGGETRTCSSRGIYGDCMEWTVTMEYQCTDDGKPVAIPPAAASAVEAGGG